MAFQVFAAVLVSATLSCLTFLGYSIYTQPNVPVINSAQGSALPPQQLSSHAHWQYFKDTYNKNYGPKEEVYRRMVFEKHLKEVSEHNLAAERGDHTYNKGINQFSDKTKHELRTLLHGFIPPSPRPELRYPLLVKLVGYENVPAAVDWRAKGYVTPVKNQGECGSCWAFSATGALEAQHYKRTGELISLSEQNLVDCSLNNSGCDGGNVMYAFDYIKMNNGIDTEESYPYMPEDGQCRFNEHDVGATSVGHEDLPPDEDVLLFAVGIIGPVSVAIHVSEDTFPYYKSGIFSEYKCDLMGLNHAVLIVGYGTENATDYWIVKNSWGDTWGEQGYIRMSRGENTCGIAYMATYPLT